MASNVKKIILIALIIAITIPTSISHRERWRRYGDEAEIRNTEQYLRDLCSKTNRSNECWKILKPESYLFDGSDEKTVVGAVIDLAIAKSNEIHDKLNQLYADSGNDELKEKYVSCSKHYNDVNRNLVVARRDLDSNNHKNLKVQVNDAEKELKSCKQEFKRESFDPAHIGDRNKELGLYLEIVLVATREFLKTI